jgi:hypothetical protein
MKANRLYWAYTIVIFITLDVVAELILLSYKTPNYGLFTLLIGAVSGVISMFLANQLTK